jgi:hypothetical protein
VVPAHPMHVLAYTHSPESPRGDRMSVMVEQSDGDTDGTGEHAVVQVHDVLADVHERARAQAARVRESLVRCPGSSGSQA